MRGDEQATHLVEVAVAPLPMLANGKVDRLGADGEAETGDADRSALETALDLGYRHIDTATAYHNEAFIGEVLAGSGIARSELFLTSKLRNADHAEAKNGAPANSTTGILTNNDTHRKNCLSCAAMP